MSKSSISVDTRPGADRYGNEKIIAFSSPVGGGLISFEITADDQLSVQVYRQDLTVQVSAGIADPPVRYGNVRLDAALYQAAKTFVADYETRQQDPDAAGNSPAGITVPWSKEQQDITALALHRMAFSAPDSEVSAGMRETALAAHQALTRNDS
jgi:hypothetical protein